MTWRTVLVFGLCLSLTAAVSASDTASAAKPNIVLIMADDFGYECVTANGGQSYQTPNLDRQFERIKKDLPARKPKKR